MPDPNAGDSGPNERQLTKRSTRAADRADSEINGSWPPPGYLCRSPRNMMLKFVQIKVLLCLTLISGCADRTRPHRKALAIGLTEATAWQHPDLKSIPTEMQLMHVGAGQSAATAIACENCLKTNPPFDTDLITMIQAYAKSSREREAQFNQAIADGRSSLNDAEREIVTNCGKTDFVLFAEILKRIKYDELTQEK